MRRSWISCVTGWCVPSAPATRKPPPLSGSAAIPFPEPQPCQEPGKDPERGDQLYLLEADLAHAVCCQQEPPDLAHLPAFRPAGGAAPGRHFGSAGARRARREYAALFPGNLLRADRFAPVELLVRQANDQPAGPKISIVVPLYNTPLDFLDEMLDSVVNQTYKNWELCCVDAGKDEAVGQHVQARAKADARIRYQKLEKNELIPGNTNQGL